MKAETEKVLEMVTREAVIDALKGVIGIPSESLQEQKLAEYMRDRLLKAGAEAQIDSHGNMIARIRYPKPGKKIYFDSHMDTVEVGNLWTRDPYGELDGDRFYGVGAVDCQASLAGMMLAIEILAKSGIELSGEAGLAAVAREQYPCVATKGTVNMLEDGFTADMCIIGEPTDLTICRGCEGMAEVIIDITGVPCHASNPDFGVNAIEVMYEVMTRIRELPVGDSEILGKGSLNFGVIEGGTRSCVLPEHCRLRISKFMVEGEDGEVLLGEINRILEEVKSRDDRIRAEAVLGYNSHAAVVYEGSPIIDVVRAGSRKVLGEAAPLTAMRAHMDSDFLINMGKIPTVAFGPGKLRENVVAGSEWVSVDDTVKAVRVYLASVIEALGN